MTEADNERPEWAPEVGTKLRGVPRQDPIHVRGYIDGHVVTRTWMKSRQHWRYEIKSIEWFWVYKFITEEQFEKYCGVDGEEETG